LKSYTEYASSFKFPDFRIESILDNIVGRFNGSEDRHLYYNDIKNISKTLRLIMILCIIIYYIYIYKENDFWRDSIIYDLLWHRTAEIIYYPYRACFIFFIIFFVFIIILLAFLT
jgi:hypothetical protein